MLMLKGGKTATLEQIRAVQTPEATRTWRPVAHRDVVESVMRLASDRGLTFEFEAALAKGRMHLAPGVNIDVPNARMFAKYTFHPHPDFKAPEGTHYTLIQVNSHDKTNSLEHIAGGHVVVCSNGVRVGELMVRRVHTPGLEINSYVESVVDQFLKSGDRMHDMVERLQGNPLTDKDAVSLIVDAADAGAIPSNKILPVVHEWRNPRHAEFQPRNAWSLYNAHTELMKDQSPSRQRDGFEALNHVFLPDAAVAVN